MLYPKGYSMNIFLVSIKIFLSNLNVLSKLAYCLFSVVVGFGRFEAKKFIQFLFLYAALSSYQLLLHIKYLFLYCSAKMNYIFQYSD